MKFLLAVKNQALLKKFVAAPTLVAFDFDGTLAPIVADRRRAALKPVTRELLATLSAAYPCVVVSGRAQSDVKTRLAGTGIRTVIGNHGIEPWHASPAMEQSVLSLLPTLRNRLRRFPGVVIENKRYSVAVHYRHEADREGVRQTMQKMSTELAPVRMVGGKMVVNVLPFQAPHKGLAVVKERERSRCSNAIYVGDDDTDEDVFALRDPKTLLTVRVGAKKDSLAEFYLRNQGEIDRLIGILIRLRRPARP